ncbi:acVLRF1 family peptidyl-tRNA hydrolase [Natronoglycomyces albus]|uniref:Actinobacteria/chloroflexi VLRF1 release factor domain-containing protein n=1 Tax=Natronoglycomyces albus TaxID=2811108 RepID=A0A895XEU4_9ACTN|nr:acVLRF1 family peptidyl-tRNA hydrolase [Natronoglycomyces albus]QSB03854.1 hypothetical protein JQS30_08425 [Natronoglycomyces albus]
MAVRSREAPGGGRILEIPAARIDRWVHGFDRRHSIVSARLVNGVWQLTGADEARCEVAWAQTGDIPAAWLAARQKVEVDLPDAQGDAARQWEDMAHTLAQRAAEPRLIGLLLARRRTFSVGLFEGQRLVRSRTGSSYVQGKTKAGGWSQQRYARRRAGQAKVASDKASEAVKDLLESKVRRLDTVVTGGDKPTVDAILADTTLAAVNAKRSLLHLGDVGEAKKAVLLDCADRINGFLVHLIE